MTVHLLPTDWVRIPLIRLITIEHGFAFRSEAFSASGMYAVTTPGNFYEEGGFRNVGSKQRYYDGNFPQAYILQPSDLIVAMTEQSDGLLGSAAFVPDKDIYLHNQRIGKVRIKRRTELSPNFLLWVFNSRYFRAAVNQTAAGTKVRHTSPSKLTSIDVLIPQIDEQQRIANALHDADSLIATLENAIAKKQAIKQGMMQQLLTGRTRLPGFTEPWVEVGLGSIANVSMGQSPAGSSYNASGRGLPLVQGNADIRDRMTVDRIWTTTPTKLCNAGDVIVTVRAPVGYTAIASKNSCLGRGVCSVSAREDNRFLFHALVYAEPKWSVYEQGSTFTAVNSNEVRSFIVSWPTDQDERHAIAEAMDDVDDDICALSARLSKKQAIKQGLMQQLLTGRTRLPVAEAAT